MKKPLAVIAKSKLSICDKSAPFAELSLSSSTVQNKIFSKHLNKSVFFRFENIMKINLRN